MTSPAEWLTDRLGGRWYDHYGSACCPAHDDHHPSLTVRDGDTAVILKCHAGCSSADIVDKLRRDGLWPIPPEASGRSEKRDTSAWALDIWRASRPIAGTIAELYLRNRGITVPLPPSLRYHRALKHRETGLTFPALVAAIQDADRHVVAVQRTFLKSDGSGKAAVSEPKMSLGAMGRGAVRLAPASETIAIAEGIETALSAMQLLEVPVWCSLGDGRLGKIALPPEVGRVVVIADIGSEARAYEARDIYRRQGREADVLFPSAGKDFNEVIRNGVVA
jgi:hypothetical protein